MSQLNQNISGIGSWPNGQTLIDLTVSVFDIDSLPTNRCQPDVPLPCCIRFGLAATVCNSLFHRKKEQ